MITVGFQASCETARREAMVSNVAGAEARALTPNGAPASGSCVSDQSVSADTACRNASRAGRNAVKVAVVFGASRRSCATHEISFPANRTGPGSVASVSSRRAAYTKVRPRPPSLSASEPSSGRVRVYCKPSRPSVRSSAYWPSWATRSTDGPVGKCV